MDFFETVSNGDLETTFEYGVGYTVRIERYRGQPAHSLIVSARDLGRQDKIVIRHSNNLIEGDLSTTWPTGRNEVWARIRQFVGE